jgi:hypothetical protein
MNEPPLFPHDITSSVSLSSTIRCVFVRNGAGTALLPPALPISIKSAKPHPSLIVYHQLRLSIKENKKRKFSDRLVDDEVIYLVLDIDQCEKRRRAVRNSQSQQ